MWRRDCDNDIAKRPQGPEESVGCIDLRGRCEGIKGYDGEEIAIKMSL